MEDLQSTLQSILSDPEQMRRITAMAESLGLGPPQGAESAGTAPDRRAESQSARSDESVPFDGGRFNLGEIMGSLSAINGTEDRVFSALRPSLSPAGQGKADRALRAAKLSRLAGRFLTRQRDSHV
ncbi:MAG: hypothetical protein J5789_07955 [Oscillospiraceae bacterium]|nr:hypothetical protein [Oscillospiraceae bacterium]